MATEHEVDPEIGLAVVRIVQTRLNRVHAVLQLAFNGERLVLKQIFVSAGHFWVESPLRVNECVVDETLDFVAKHFDFIVSELSHELLDAFTLAGDLLS